MALIDVFNGDADGICALIQWRHAHPASSTLVTGVKRDIQLLEQVSVKPGDTVTVLDVSLDKNRDSLVRILKEGASVFYVDHHFAGDIPQAKQLTTMINTAPDICTSILMNQQLKGQCIEWAVTGAFGDNLRSSAHTLAKSLTLTEQQLNDMEKLGIYINYNGYGSAISDLHFPPEQLYQLASVHTSPLGFINDSGDSFKQLEAGYLSDMSMAANLKAEFVSDCVAVYILPDTPWARRVSGVYSNDLANQQPNRAHAVVTKKASGDYLISVRAPLNNKTGADQLCRGFTTGGGRAAAAGINNLPADQLSVFIDRFKQAYSMV